MVAGLVAARPALQISADRPAATSSIADFHTDSNGCAAGNTREEAIVQGFLELVERDAYAIWWYNRLQRPEIDLSQFDDSYIRDIRAQFVDYGRKIWVLDVTSDLGVPTYVAIMHWMQDGKENIEFGSGAHFDRRIAHAARADGAQPVPVDQRDRRRRHARRQVDARRHDAAQSGELSVPDPGASMPCCRRRNSA